MGWGNIIGASIDAAKSERQNQASHDATAAQINSARDAMKFDLSMYNQNRGDNLNALVTGNSAVNALAKLYGLDMYSGDVNTNPITMTGGTATASGSAKWYDPGAFFTGGSKLTTTPVEFSNGATPAATETGGINPSGTTQAGNGSMDFTSFLQSPDYLFALNQGQQGMDRGAAARGSLFSGGHSADLVDYNQGKASQQLGNYTNNLMRIAGFGGEASGQIGSFGNSTASRVGNQLTNAGNARATGYYNSANSYGNMMSNWGQAFNDWYGQRQGSAMQPTQASTQSGGSSQTRNIGPWS